ncbi:MULTISPECIES: copper chaperone PCu(A)C [unclassified Pseudomonas]|uniref:copper chaperone PCu(A)C n=1 Tax=unclassified Pseudomonas TaxID=196821 RepID=UPI000D3CAC81|nr:MULTISPECIES: copper chaperone PCu(A)C [unclassified Pseudomonas]RAU43160.1 copper chaperone PCu(A)C [Pseudomonas sp. RIT 409]RAU53450.1 copper chaperone PCu(A)C [Pseudomonas sp. RIT 412]
MLKTLLLLAVLLPACFADAHDYAKGNLAIAHPWSMELPPNAPTVAAYFVIQNSGSDDDRLMGADSPIAGAAQLHEHVSKDGLIKMQQVQTVSVPAGGTVTFAPMAYHVMLLDVKDRSRLTEGLTFPLNLHFEKAGDVTVQVMVQKQPPDASTSHTH